MLYAELTHSPPGGRGKYDQELLFGCEAWHTVYATLRNSIEGFNGFVKDGAHEVLDDPERRRVRGVAAQSVFTALLLFAANLRKVITFLREEGAMETGVLKRLPRRRRSRSLRSWVPEGAEMQQSGPDPPLTA